MSDNNSNNNFNAYNIQPSSSASGSSGSSSSSSMMTSGAPAPLPVQAAPVPGKTMSIIALILPFLCCWPVGLILAIVGFVQMKGHPRGLAVAALIVNSFFAFLSVIGLLLSPSESDLRSFDSFDSASAPVVAPARPAKPAVEVNKSNAHSIADKLEAEIDLDR